MPGTTPQTLRPIRETQSMRLFRRASGCPSPTNALRRVPSSASIQNLGMSRGTETNFVFASRQEVASGSMKTMARAPSEATSSQRLPVLNSSSTMLPVNSLPLYSARCPWPP